MYSSIKKETTVVNKKRINFEIVTSFFAMYVRILVTTVFGVCPPVNGARPERAWTAARQVVTIARNSAEFYDLEYGRT